MECWGPLEGPGGRGLCGVEVELRPSPLGGCVYRRGGFSVLLSSCSLRLRPRAPVHHPDLGVLGYALLRLEPPVHVEAGGSVRLSLLVEVDAEASTPGGGVVDVFPLAPRRLRGGRLALYGPPRGGVLARLLRPSPPAAGSCGALLEAVLVNEAGRGLRVARILLPLRPGDAEPLGGCLARLPRVTARLVSPSAARVQVEGGGSVVMHHGF